VTIHITFVGLFETIGILTVVLFAIYFVFGFFAIMWMDSGTPWSNWWYDHKLRKARKEFKITIIDRDTDDQTY
jgi:ABC-type Fe3+ transport system permease subunit